MLAIFTTNTIADEDTPLLAFSQNMDSNWQWQSVWEQFSDRTHISLTEFTEVSCGFAS